ncbi:hypothetical protein OAA11_01630 [Schleiferiaceae bacterium]|nr:hypothetical protein [Schleiferiaceae bacterium]
MTTAKPNFLQVSLANAIILSVLLTLFLSVNSTVITDLAQVLVLALASQLLSSYFFLRFLFSRSLPSRKPFITLFLCVIASFSSIYLFWLFSFLLNYLGIPNFNDGNYFEVEGNLFGVLIAPIAMSLLSFWVIIIGIISYGVSDALLKRI